MSAMHLTPHPQWYLQDGDIILSVHESTTSRVLFRVHRVFLSHYSQVFRDMFLVASGQGTRETFDGVPLINMPDDDTAESIAALLHVLYNSR